MCSYNTSFCFALFCQASTLTHSILFYSIPFHSIPFHSILFYSILFYSILFYSILFYSIISCIITGWRWCTDINPWDKSSTNDIDWNHFRSSVTLFDKWAHSYVLVSKFKPSNDNEKEFFLKYPLPILFNLKLTIFDPCNGHRRTLNTN